MYAHHLFCLLLSAVLLCMPPSVSHAQHALPKYQPPAGELSSQAGAWESWRVGGITVQRRVLELKPRAEPKPALSVALMPNEFNMKEGNAAIQYLQALGFLEQANAQRAKADFENASREAAIKEGKSVSQVPPNNWYDTRPEDLPISQVKEYLAYTSFQPKYLAEAVQRRTCSFDRHIRDVENPVMYLLPEIQSMRELARQQSLRFLLAIAEDRPNDAVAILGQQFAVGYHLNQEPFLVSNLVGIACAGIGLSDAFFLCEHADAPNLYWAVATLPQPLVDMRPAMAYEREFLFEQFKELRDVDATPRSNLYWSQFLERFGKSMEGFSSETVYLKQFDQFGKSGLTMMVAAVLPGARRFLHEVEGMSVDELDGLPNTQVFFLAVKKFHEHARDEMFKWEFVAHWEREQLSEQVDANLQRNSQEFGLITMPSGLVLPAVSAAMSAQTRLTQQLAYLQTVESIRNHLATHSNIFPDALEDLALPAPLDPATGKTFEYARHDQGATLTGGSFPGLRYQFELRCSPK